MSSLNVFADDWDEGLPSTHQSLPSAEGWRQRVKRIIPPGQDLGMSLYELGPRQTQVPYHFHHGFEEVLLVLRGQPTLRTPEGERELRPGDAVYFPKGPAGAHQVMNRGSEPVRYVIAASHTFPEVTEYPDSGKIFAVSRSESMRGGPLRSVHRLADAVGYFDGEEARA